MRRFHFLFFFVLAFSISRSPARESPAASVPPAARAEPAIAIQWDRASAKPVQTGAYARVRALRDGRLMLVYSDGPEAWSRVSRDRGASWERPRRVARHRGWVDTNAELLELDNGWLIYGLNSRPARADDGKLPYVIRTLISRDGGRSWGDERDAFVGGKVWGDGCWEPAFLQLPSGELQLYFANEAPYPHSNEQEISLLRSFDRGLSWSKPLTVSFRAGKRDGMPVPVLLPAERVIVCAIEDNGFAGDFKPVTVRTTLAANWTDGAVSADSPRRRGALRGDFELAPAVYAGAPYLLHLGSDATALVVQSSAGRRINDADHAVPVIYVSARGAVDFCRPTSPFAWLPPEASALWNSLTLIDEHTVMLVSSISGADASTDGPMVWTIVGRVVRGGGDR